jgi:hypothetical protein
MLEHSRICAGACLAIGVAACAVDHSGPEAVDAGPATGITILIERIDASLAIAAAPDPQHDGDASTGQAVAVISTAPPPACPPLTLSIVGPHQVYQGDAVAYEAHVMGRPDSALEYGWSASKGELSMTDGIRTEYTCTSSGAAAITLRASELGQSEQCGTAMALALWCVPLPD